MPGGPAAGEGGLGSNVSPKKIAGGGERPRPLRQESDSGAILVIPSQGRGQPVPRGLAPAPKATSGHGGPPKSLLPWSYPPPPLRAPQGEQGWPSPSPRPCPTPLPSIPWGLRDPHPEASAPSRPVGTPSSPPGLWGPPLLPPGPQWGTGEQLGGHRGLCQEGPVARCGAGAAVGLPRGTPNCKAGHGGPLFLRAEPGGFGGDPHGAPPKGLGRAAHTHHGGGGGFRDVPPPSPPRGAAVRSREVWGAAASPWLRDAGPAPLRQVGRGFASRRRRWAPAVRGCRRPPPPRAEEPPRPCQPRGGRR